MANSPVQIDFDALRAREGEIEPAGVIAVVDDEFARYILVAMQDREQLSLDHLAEIVVGFESVDRGDIAGRSDLAAVRVRLHHVTLPKLAELGYLSFDHEAGTVTNEGIPEAVVALLGMEV